MDSNLNFLIKITLRKHIYRKPWQTSLDQASNYLISYPGLAPWMRESKYIFFFKNFIINSGMMTELFARYQICSQSQGQGNKMLLAASIDFFSGSLDSKRLIWL